LFAPNRINVSTRRVRVRVRVGVWVRIWVRDRVRFRVRDRVRFRVSETMMQCGAKTKQMRVS